MIRCVGGSRNGHQGEERVEKREGVEMESDGKIKGGRRKKQEQEMEEIRRREKRKSGREKGGK